MPASSVIPNWLLCELLRYASLNVNIYHVSVLWVVTGDHFWTRPPLTTCTRHGCCLTAYINLNIIYLHCYAFFLHLFKFRVHPHSGLTVQYTRKLALMVSFFTLTTRGHLLYFVFYLCPLGTHFLIFVGVCHHQRLNLFKHLLLAPSRCIYIALTHSKKQISFFGLYIHIFPVKLHANITDSCVRSVG